MRVFVVKELFVYVVIVAGWWLYLEPNLETNGHGVWAGFDGAYGL